MKKIISKSIKHKLALVVTILGLIGLVSGTSYAVLKGNTTSEHEQIIKAGSVLLKLTENYESIDKKIRKLDDEDGLLQYETYSFNIRNIGNVVASFDLKLVNEVPDDYTGDVLADEYIKIGLEINGEEHGPFSLEEVNNIIDSNVINRNEIINYELRLWLDKEKKEELADMENYKSFLTLEVEAKQSAYSQGGLDTSGANAPVLSGNMIPVYYDETCSDDEGCWKKADENNKDEKYLWYNYDEKIWANSVTVSSANRTSYLDAKPGTTIPMTDILTMQVWIPRYKYTVWNYNSDGEQTSEPQQINIEFESGTTTTGEISCTDNIQGTSDGTKNGTDPTTSETCKIKSTGAICTDATCNGKTYTHPAFTFGDEELQGFWVGKFEVSSDTNCTAAISAVGEGCNLTSIKPLVKPDVTSWRGAMVGTFENNIMAMNDTDNKYGFSTADDTHMMKNSEWGAVAYLSHSKYGTCKDGKCREININNSESFYTGRSGGDPYADPSEEGTYKYNQTKKETLVLTGGTNITPSVTNDTTYPWSENNGLYKSSTQGIHESETILTFDFTVENDNTYLSFDWSASTDGYYGDYLAYAILKDDEFVDEEFIGGLDFGETEDEIVYENVTLPLEIGSYTLMFGYFKDDNGSNGTDTGYVKNIKIVDNPEVKVEILPIGEGKDGPGASTTGNIYGIYDMNGGSYEYVMGNIVSPDGETMMSGDRASNNQYSGYSGILYYDGTIDEEYVSYTGTYEYPNNKYYDKYSFSTNDVTIEKSKLGDGIKEMYDNYDNYYVAGDLPWFVRGSGFDGGSYAGVFVSYSGQGFGDSVTSAHLVISQ